MYMQVGTVDPAAPVGPSSPRRFRFFDVDRGLENAADHCASAQQNATRAHSAMERAPCLQSNLCTPLRRRLRPLHGTEREPHPLAYPVLKHKARAVDGGSPLDDVRG